MGQKQGQRLKLTQETTVRQEQPDMVDMQSIVAGAHADTQTLIEKHNGDRKKIEKEILEMEIPKNLAGIKDFNYREEVLGAVGWLLLMNRPGLLVNEENPILLHFQRTLEESSRVPIKE